MRAKLWKSALIGLAATTAFAQSAMANPILVFDAGTGAVLQQSDVFRRWYPASLTKLMTAYVTFKAIKDGELTLQSPITISRNALRQAPSKMGYPVGSVMNADNAITMMLVKSANDIAMALAENIGGSEQAFVARMNAQAHALGLSDTHYVNPNGLPEEGQFTSARDLAVLVSALRRDFPDRMHYFSIEGITAGKRSFGNLNVLIGRYPGAVGMKTGFICDSGYNMIGAATHNGRTLVAVVLGDRTVTSRADTTAALLDQGFTSQDQTSVTLSSLVRPADMPDTPASVRDMACPKPPPVQKDAKKGVNKAEPGETADAGETVPPSVKSRWVLPLDHAPTYVVVGLGNATGPIPAGKLNEHGEAYADVPVPAWRPDVAAPGGDNATVSVPPAQGDTVQGLRN